MKARSFRSVLSGLFAGIWLLICSLFLIPQCPLIIRVPCIAIGAAFFSALVYARLAKFYTCGDKHFVIVLSDRGFGVESAAQEQLAEVIWARVTKITAFKLDLWSKDLVCIEFEQENGTSVRTNEEMPGYDALKKTLPLRFAGLNVEWEKSVVLPAFATNLTVLWSKGN